MTVILRATIDNYHLVPVLLREIITQANTHHLPEWSTLKHKNMYQCRCPRKYVVTVYTAIGVTSVLHTEL